MCLFLASQETELFTRPDGTLAESWSHYGTLAWGESVPGPQKNLGRFRHVHVVAKAVNPSRANNGVCTPRYCALRKSTKS